MIRLAVVIETLGRGGAERLLVDTARLLDRSRFALRVYTLFPARRDYAEALRALEVPEECLELAGPREILTGVRRLRACLRGHQADVVHTHLFAANLIGRLAARRERVPVVSTYHDADYEPVVRQGNPGLTAPKQALLRVLDALTATWSRARIVTVSEYVAESMRRHLFLPASRITVIPNAVDVQAFAPDRTKGDATRAALGLGPDVLVVTCVGRMTPQKGQDLLLRAFVDVKQAVPKSRLLLVGDGAHRREYEELARELGLGDTLRFLGIRTDVPSILRASDLLVLPSRHEGFGLVLAEAMASGTPVVAARISPITEIVRDRETGVLFDPGSVTGLTRALTTLLQDSDLRLAMSVRARANAVARFSAVEMVRRLETLYVSLVPGATP